MKPTMPMNAYPPGGPGAPGGAGTPPGGGGYPPPGGGYPPGGSYPGGSYPGGSHPGGFPPPQQPPPKKSNTMLYLGIGCGCLAILGCLVGGGVVWGIGSLGPGEEVVSTPINPGTPFTLSYVQDGSQKYEAWLEVDVGHTADYSLTGTILLSENDSAFGQYTVADDGDGSAIEERDGSTRINWTHTSSATDGTVSLFPIPERTNGATISLSGTISGTPGTTGTMRLIVAKRD